MKIPLRPPKDPRRLPPAAPRGVAEEMWLGAGSGALAAPLIALGLAAGAGWLPLASAIGAFGGAVIGLLLWSSAPGLPSDPVPPPDPGNRIRPSAKRRAK